MFDFSIESHVHDVVHKVFWDLLHQEIHQDPPQFKRSLVLIEDIKQVKECFHQNFLPLQTDSSGTVLSIIFH